jgi:AcrR family transcriptional regulator
MTITTGSNSRREPVLMSADSVILHKGFTGTSIDDIIDRASITRGSFFHHFDVEPGLAKALMQRYP